MLKSFFYFFLFFPVVIYASSWDVEYWQDFEVTNWKSDPYRLYTTGEVRFNKDISRSYYYRLTGNLAYEVHKHLNLEMHGSYIYSHGKNSTRFTNKSRLELEANPHFKLNNGLELKWRDRVEFLKRQAVHFLQYIFRHRLTLVYPIENCGRIKSISCSDEFFYDIAKGKFTQNRFKPLIVKIAMDKDTFIECYVMIRNFSDINTGQWFKSIVLGSGFDF